MEKLEFEQLLQLMNHVAAADLNSFTYESDTFRLTMKRKQPRNKPGKNRCARGPADAQGKEQSGAPVPTAVIGGEPTSDEAGGMPAGKVVTSPLVGTFYVAPAQGAEPFVRVGDSVKAGQVLGIVEAMKLMNDIESEFDGVVVKILVQDGEPVEYGQPLFCIG